jgi:hypothetical protein
MTRHVATAGYVVLFSTMVVFQFTAVLGRRVPTLGSTLRLVSKCRGGRLSLLAGWLWLGWHLFVRGNWG